MVGKTRVLLRGGRAYRIMGILLYGRADRQVTRDGVLDVTLNPTGISSETQVISHQKDHFENISAETFYWTITPGVVR